MTGSTHDIIAKLQKEIMPLQGLRHHASAKRIDVCPAPLRQAFPGRCFPLGAVHEFITSGAPGESASAAFISALISPLMQTGGTCIWISAYRKLFPPALQSFGIEPHRVIFIDLKKDKDILWTVEEALKCEGIVAVIGEMKELSFLHSRRLQLAVEKSRVTAFIIRHPKSRLTTTACVSRFRIEPMPSVSADDLPGVGFSKWKVDLLKVRNGKPGSWEMMYADGQLKTFYPVSETLPVQHKKTG